MILKRLFGSSIGRKILVATTGLLLIGFVIGHMLGNWNMFFGREEMNACIARAVMFAPLDHPPEAQQQRRSCST